MILPYVTAILQPSDYAIVSLISVYALILIPIINLGTLDLIALEYHTKTRSEFNKLSSTLMFLYLRNALIIVGILLILPHKIIDYTQISRLWLINSVFLAFLVLVFESLNSLWITQKKAWHSALLNVSKGVIEAILILLLLSWLGWQGRIWAWIISALIIAIYALVYLKKNNHLFLYTSKKINKSSINFGYPLIIQRLSYFILNQSDILFITNMISLQIAGVYSLGYKLGSIIFIINASIFSIYSPMVYEVLAGKKIYSLKKATFYYALILIIATVQLIVFAPYLFLFFDQDYAEGVQIVRWIALSSFFWSCFIIVHPYLMYYKKTKFIGISSFCIAVINLILNYFMIKKFGFVGAAYATLVSYVLYFITALAYFLLKIKKMIPVR